MATAPTVSTVSPPTGLTRGRTWVLVTGTHFPTQAVGEGATPKARVLFGDREASDVRVQSSTRLTCLTPDNDPGPVAVSVEEIATGLLGSLAGAFSFTRPDLTVDTNLVRVLKAVILFLRRGLLDNVVRLTHTEYDALFSDEKNQPERAKLPCVVLIGPKIQKDPTYAATEAESVQSGDPPTSFVKRRAPIRRDLRFDVDLLARTDAELLSLIHHATIALEVTPYLEAPDPSNPGAETVQWDLDVEDAFDAAQETPNGSNVRSARGAFVVRGVTISDGETLEAGPVVQSVGPTALILGMQQLED